MATPLTEAHTEPEIAPAADEVARRRSARSMRSLFKRLFSSAALIGWVLVALFWLPVWAFAATVTAFIGISLFEFFTMVRHRGILVHRPLSVALGVLFAVLVAWRTLVEPRHLALTVPLIGKDVTMFGWVWDIFWPATIVLIFLRQFTRSNTFEALSSLATTLFGLAYIAGLFTYFFYIRTFKGEAGPWLVCYLVLLTKMGDAGALTLGKLFGRHTLIARISPRKTVEGFVGGVLVSGLTGGLAVSMVHRLHGSFWAGLGLGIFLGLFGQLGDLAESLLKRDCQVKDASGLFPGLGGMLDVLDSVLFTAPLFYAFLIYG